mgnify:CR=1 FL=1
MLLPAPLLADVVTSLPPLPHNGDFHHADFCFDLVEAIEVTRADGTIINGTANVEWCYTSTGIDWWNFENERMSITGSIAGLDFAFLYDEPGGHADDNLESTFRGSPFAWNHLMTFAFRDYADFVPRPLVIDGQELYGVTSGHVQFIKEEVPAGPLPADGTRPGNLIEYVINPAFDYQSDTGPIRRVRGVSAPVSVSAVPEPSAFVLLGAIGLIAAGRRWRSRHRDNISATRMITS